MIIKSGQERIAPYLRDASNFSGGKASEVIVPESPEELIAWLRTNTEPITVAGAGTGLTASRIPLEGKIVSLERFDSQGAIYEGVLEVGPARSLQNLNTSLKGSGWFYPPNPTEWLASIGGTVATNASGSRSYKYGATREFIEALDIVLVDGRSTRIRRGQTIEAPLHFDDGSVIVLPEIEYRSPDCKNAAGFYIQPKMDWVDLFVGSEGTLALFTGIHLRLLPAPDEFLSAILFLESEEACWDLVDQIRGSEDDSLDPCSLEYFDRYSLDRLKGKFPGIPPSAQSALFFEQAVLKMEMFDEQLETWYEFLENRPVLLEESWFAQSPADLEKFHDFRHQVPLILNEENSRLGRVKMGTDMAVSDEHFFDMMNFYREQLGIANIDYVMFGHIGDNHLHINLLPNEDQKGKARATYDVLVDRILQWGGTVSAEHGIGKLKKDYFSRMVGERTLEELKKIKKRFDPENRLGVGNLL